MRHRATRVTQSDGDHARRATDRAGIEAILAVMR